MYNFSVFAVFAGFEKEVLVHRFFHMNSSLLCVSSSGLTDAEIYTNEETLSKNLKNNGFVFLTFTNHRNALTAKRVLCGMADKVGGYIV